MSSDNEERYTPAPKINFNDDNLNPSYYYVDAQLPFSPNLQQTNKATNGYNEYFSNLRNIINEGSQDKNLYKTSSKTKLIQKIKNRKIIAVIALFIIIFVLLLFVILISVGFGATCSFNKCPTTTTPTLTTTKPTNPSNSQNTFISLSTEITTTTTKKVISPTHTYIASTSSFDSKIRIWDVTSGELASAYDFSNGGHTNSITVLLPIGNGLLASASLDTTIKIWDIYKNSLRKTFEGLSVGHSQQVNCLLLMDNYLASGSDDGSIKIWDLNSLELYKTITNGLSRVTSLIKLDSSRLVSADYLGYIRVWNVLNGFLEKIFDMRSSFITGMLSISSNAFISTQMDNSIKFISLYNSVIRQVNLNDIKCTVTNGSFVFVGSNQIRMFDAYSGFEINAFNSNTQIFLQNKIFKSMALVGRKSLAAVYSDNTIGVYDLGGLYERMRLRGHAKSVNSVLAINENTLASGSDDSLIIVWDLSTGKQIKTLDTGNDIKLLSLIY